MLDQIMLLNDYACFAVVGAKKRRDLAKARRCWLLYYLTAYLYYCEKQFKPSALIIPSVLLAVIVRLLQGVFFRSRTET